MDALRGWGWDARFESVFDALGIPDCQPARVIEAQRDALRVVTGSGERQAQVAGRLLQEGVGPLPAVGDWVAVHVLPDTVIVHAVLERRTKISRKLPGKSTREQVLAANVDTVFMVTSCNVDFNPRRVERYLAMIWESGARPVVLLNKSDLVADSASLVHEAEAVAPGVAVHTVCATSGSGLAALAPHLKRAETIALLGSSGVGKSTIVNRLMGADVQVVRETREGDDRGRHTTASRHLFRLPSGALLLDTPGLRELALWSTDSGLEQVFSDIEALAEGCRFQDCAHTNEPDCAVKAAADEGRLPAERLESYLKLRKELEYLERKSDPEAGSNVKRRWRTIHKNMRTARKRGWMRDES
jgi:ribosome biogenesis GTPase